MPFSRLSTLIGSEALATIQAKTVCIIGLGGVGGSAAEAIARSGYGTIVLVDQDVIEPSNINRQLVALQSTMNRPKVDVMKERILDINPDCQVITHHLFYDNDTKAQVFATPIDYIIDAIDTITYKIDLVEEAYHRNIPMISVMGTGNKYHPDQLTILPLADTTYDPIARIMRQKLKQKHNLKHIPVVASLEPPQVVDARTTSPSSNAFVPTTAGILAANYVFLHTIGKIT